MNYRTKQIADIIHVHPNTVRLYEEWGFISPVPRQKNGYRTYSDLHVKQMQVARLAFRSEFIQNNLRKKATLIVRESGKEDFQRALALAKQYLKYLQQERDYALQAVQMVQRLIQYSDEAINDVRYSHRQIANELQITEETIRNWERNGLFSVERDSRNRRLYNQSDYNKLMVIRTLRSAHYSIASIRYLFSKLEIEASDSIKIQDILNSPNAVDEFFHVTDRLEFNLRETIEDTKKIIAILQPLESDSL